MTAIANIPALLGASQNSFIGLILQILLDQDFAPINAKPLEEGDQKIGELTALERAIFAAHSKKSAQFKENNFTEEENGPEMRQKMLPLGTEIKNLHNFFWQSVRYRLYKEGHQDFEKIELRSDGSIVAVTPDENDKPTSKTLTIRIRA